MENLINETESYVSSLLTKELPAEFLYHSLSHTQRVVKFVKELIEGEQIAENEIEPLILAAWLHDVGYTKTIEDHEAFGVEIATEFLKSRNLNPDLIDKVITLIQATKIGYEPKTISEKIICDADCAHFGSKNFEDLSDLLREEWKLLDLKQFSDLEWIEENIKFLTRQHRYYTDYAQEHWQMGKDRNLANLLKKVRKIKKETSKEKKRETEFKFKVNKARLPERGIETMFRVTLRNHITLSDIADTKANILLSVNAIIVSLVLANLIPKLDNPSNTYLIYPTLIFVLFSVTSMILSVVATRPNVTSGKFTKEDVKNKKVNLLFFGNFHKMDLDEFEWAMNEMMQDKDYLYSSMTKDLYFLGKVLDRKYKILRITYTIFMIGIIVSVMAFGLAFKYS